MKRYELTEFELQEEDFKSGCGGGSLDGGRAAEPAARRLWWKPRWASGWGTPAASAGAGTPPALWPSGRPAPVVPWTSRACR